MSLREAWFAKEGNHVRRERETSRGFSKQLRNFHLRAKTNKQTNHQQYSWAFAQTTGSPASSSSLSGNTRWNTGNPRHRNQRPAVLTSPLRILPHSAGRSRKPQSGPRLELLLREFLSHSGRNREIIRLWTWSQMLPLETGFKLRSAREMQT